MESLGCKFKAFSELKPILTGLRLNILKIRYIRVYEKRILFIL